MRNVREIRILKSSPPSSLPQRFLKSNIFKTEFLQHFVLMVIKLNTIYPDFVTGIAKYCPDFVTGFSNICPDFVTEYNKNALTLLQ